MLLRTGDQGDAVKSLQRGLNRLGAMLLVDGDFGLATRNALVQARDQLGQPGPPEADDDFQRAVAAIPDPFPLLTAAGVTFIARQEVTDASVYERLYKRPTCPPAPSGVTIGIGYDCRFVGPGQLATDWGDVLPPPAIAQLSGVTGKPGTPSLLAGLSTVVVPLGAAMRVFASRSLPTYAARTRSMYPQLDSPALSAAQRTALVSLVYNCGASLDGDRRREMRAIRDLLAAGSIDPVADQFDSMARLWDPTTEGGLVRRRHAEATLWRSGFGALQLE